MTGIVSPPSSTFAALPDDSIAGDLNVRLPEHADTLAGSILHRIAATPDREAFRYPGHQEAWDSMTWGQAGLEIITLALGFQVGFATALDGRIAELVPNLAEIQPTFMAGVPRVFENIYTAANTRAHAGGALRRKAYAWAIDTSAGIKASRRTGPLARLELALADLLVYHKVHALTGGRIRYFVCESGALDRDVARWFDAAGMPILETYGLTETSAAATLVRPDDQVFGTVGQPIPGTEIRIAPDDEILLRGPHLMTGYHNLPEENADVLLADGWLATGDTGSLDDGGRLQVTDRKKDLVKTSRGKYIAPGAIASRFKSITALGSHLIVHARNRHYVTALVSLDPDALAAFATAHQMPGEPVTLSQSVPVRAAIQETINDLNATLKPWETIKQFTILTRDLTEARGELTTSLKVKRKVVEQHFTHQLDAMYP